MVQAAGAAAVGAGETAAPAVELEAVRVAAALSEDFEGPGIGMITPDGLAFEMDPGNCRCARAALCPIDPAVGPPVEAVGRGMRILQSEPAQPDFRVGIRPVILIPVRVKEKVRGIQYPHAAASREDAGGDVESGNEVFCRLECAVLIAVFENADPVPARNALGRRGRRFVIHGAEVLVVLNDLESGGERVLEELDHPKAASGVEVEVERLADQRFRSHQFHFKAGCDLERVHSLPGRERLGVVCNGTAALELGDKLGERLVHGRCWGLGRQFRGCREPECGKPKCTEQRPSILGDCSTSGRWFEAGTRVFG